jgi:hypothetical protein
MSSAEAVEAGLTTAKVVASSARDGNGLGSGRPKTRPAKNYSRVEFNTQTRTRGCNLSLELIGFWVPAEFL